MNKYLVIASIAMIGLIAFLVSIVSDLRDDKKVLESLVNQANAVIAKYERDQQTVADIDRKYSKALNDAKDEINRLYAGVIAGSVRLRVNAECTGAEETRPGGVAHESTARLNRAAEYNYLLLRERIAQSEQQILGLQAYINNVCLN